MVSFGFDESTTLQARNPNPSPSPGSSMLQPWLQPETRWRRSTSRRSRGRSSGGPARTRRSALGGSDAFGHSGRSVGCSDPAPHAPRSARAPLTLRPTPASALLQPGPAGCRRGRGARWARRGGSARAARDRVGRVGRAERSARRLASAGCPCRRRRCAERRARCRNGLPLGRRSCDGARATSSVSTVATLAPRSQESRRQVKSLHEVLQCHQSFFGRHRRMVVGDGSKSPSESTVDRAKLVK